jgi:hypothetical protein
MSDVRCMEPRAFGLGMLGLILLLTADIKRCVILYVVGWALVLLSTAVNITISQQGSYYYRIQYFNAALACAQLAIAVGVIISWSNHAVACAIGHSIAVVAWFVMATILSTDSKWNPFMSAYAFIAALLFSISLFMTPHSPSNMAMQAIAGTLLVVTGTLKGVCSAYDVDVLF